MIKTVVPAVVTLIIGLVVGFIVGRVLLERQWQSPFVNAPAPRSKGDDANPSPNEGARVLKAMPFGRSRKALREACAQDPLVSTVAAVGGDESGFELHVVVENRGKCKVTELSGVAYGFDAWGKPAPLNKAGEHYVSFEAKGQSIAPGDAYTVAERLKGIELATLAIAQVDQAKCADGTSWARK